MGVRPSMGSVGDAYENALCGSFFGTLVSELLDRDTFRSPGYQSPTNLEAKNGPAAA